MTWAFVATPYDAAALRHFAISSTRVTARDGTPLRVTLGSSGTRAEWAPLQDISPWMAEATVAAEDRRFFNHCGVDPIAASRAAIANIKAKRVVRGGSTLTQQLAGLVWPEPRTWLGKLRESVRAIRIEHDFSKQEILEQYLNRVPYGPGVHGVAAASRRAFQRAPNTLAPAQAATLAALPQAPDRLARASERPRLRARRDRILQRMHERHDLSDEEYAEARASEIDFELATTAFAAPHFADYVLASLPPHLRRATHIETTLDASLQSEVEGIVQAQLASLRGRGVHEMAIVVQSLDSREIRALVGSPSWDESQVNGALAARQPGSTLKPLLYGLAFTEGLSPADLLADMPFAALDAGGGEVAPRNFDGRWHGPVRAREALASSFNIPAVRLQAQLGTAHVLAAFRDAGLKTLDADNAEGYGLGLALGAGEVTLLDLTNAYCSLARGGAPGHPISVTSARENGKTLASSPSAKAPISQASTRVSHSASASGNSPFISPSAAFLVADILSDDTARIAGFGSASVLDLPFTVAVKTGTSSDYRNSWCIGFAGDHAVGVWVGNFDGTSLHGLAGASGAGPVFRAIMLRLAARGERAWSATPPPGWQRAPICPLSGARPGSACSATMLEWFAPGAWERREDCSFHRLQDGERVVNWPSEYRDWSPVRAAALAQTAFSPQTASPSHAASSPHIASSPRIASPLDGAVYFRDPRLGEASAIRFVARDPHPADVWFLDGRRISSRPDGSALWAPLRGDHALQLRRHDRVEAIRFSVR